MAQSITGTALATTAVATKRVPCVDLRIGWGLTTDPADWDLQAHDETARLIDASWSRQLDMSGPIGLGRSPAAELSITLDNHDQRFSPFNEGGAIYGSLSDTTTLPDGTTIRYPRLFMVPVRLRVGFYSGATPEYLAAFYGYVDEPQSKYGVSGSTVTLRCLDRASKLIQRKASTGLYNAQRTDDWLAFLVESIGSLRVDRSNLDAGIIQIPYCWLDDENAWSEINAAASSEGGYAYFDETGAFRFRNAAWWATAADSTSSVFTFTTARWADLMPHYDWRNVATGAVVEYQARVPGGEQVLWESRETIIVEPGGAEVEARFEYPAEQIYQPAIRTDWLPVNGGGMLMSEHVAVSVDTDYAQRATVTFTNTSQETAFVTKMRIRGRAIIGGPSEEIDRDIAAPLVPPNKVRMSGNAYVQTPSQANLLADLMADRMQYPRLTYSLATVPAIPWLQLGDRVTITANAPITTPRTAIITKLSYTYGQNGFVMTVDAVDAAGLYLYNDLCIIGTDTVGQTSVAFR